MNRRDLIPCALILAAFIAVFGVAVHRLPAEMAYAPSLGDQRPPVPQVMPGQLASFGQSRFLPTPGTRYARQPSVNTGQDAGSTPAASTNGGVPDSTDGATRGSRRTARPQQGKPHNRQSGGNASGGLAASAGGATAFLRASAPGERPGTSSGRGSSVVERITAVRAGSIPAPATTVTPDGAIRKDAQAGAIGCHCSRAAAADGPYGSRASGTNTCHAGRNQRSANSHFKAKRGAGEFREGK